jgi:hypothetical protein
MFLQQTSRNGTMFAKHSDEEPTRENLLPLLAPPQSLISGQVLSMAADLLTPCTEAGPRTPETEVVEIPVLLPGWQAMALEDAAHVRGLTAGEMLRHLLAGFFARPRSQPEETEPRQNGSEAAWG